MLGVCPSTAAADSAKCHLHDCYSPGWTLLDVASLEACWHKWTHLTVGSRLSGWHSALGAFGAVILCQFDVSCLITKGHETLHLYGTDLDIGQGTGPLFRKDANAGSRPYRTRMECA